MFLFLQAQTISTLSIIPQIGTAIGLIAFIVAIVFYFLRTQSGNDLEKIKSTKEEDRANLLRDLSDKYSIPTNKISPDQQFLLLKDKLELDYRKRNQTFRFLAFVTVVIGILVALIIIFDDKKQDTKNKAIEPMKAIFDNISNGDTIRNNSPSVKGKIVGTIISNKKFYAVLKITNQYNILTKIDLNNENRFDFTASIFAEKELKIGIISCDEIADNNIEKQLKNQNYILTSLPDGSELIGSVDIYKK